MSNNRNRILSIAVIVMVVFVALLAVELVVLLVSVDNGESDSQTEQTAVAETESQTATASALDITQEAAENPEPTQALPTEEQPSPTVEPTPSDTPPPPASPTAEPPSPTALPTASPAAADTATPQPTDTPTPAPIFHEVAAGETLFRIANAYGTTVQEILDANEISNPNIIQPGLILLIPVDPNEFDESSAAQTLQAPAPTQVILATPTPASTAPPPTAAPTAAPTDVPPTALPTEAAPVVPQPSSVDSINGIPVSNIVVMPANVVQRSREIFAAGQQLGRNPRAFSKVGDSTIENPHFLTRFDSEPYNLGIYSFLQPTIDYFAGSHSREGAAVRRGLHSWTATDPFWADKELCQPNETPIGCEIRLHNPAILLIRLGSNDSGVPAGFDLNMRLIVDEAIANGVLPVIGTKADRFEGESNVNNQLLRQIAADYQIPLWDFDLAASTLPGRGLSEDDVHMTIYYAHDYTAPASLQRGHSVHNLTALMVLDRIWKEVIQASG